MTDSMWDMKHTFSTDGPLRCNGLAIHLDWVKLFQWIVVKLDRVDLEL